LNCHTRRGIQYLDDPSVNDIVRLVYDRQRLVAVSMSMSL